MLMFYVEAIIHKVQISKKKKMRHHLSVVWYSHMVAAQYNLLYLETLYIEILHSSIKTKNLSGQHKMV